MAYIAFNISQLKKNIGLFIMANKILPTQNHIFIDRPTFQW